jgi:hypothetical protein
MERAESEQPSVDPSDPGTQPRDHSAGASADFHDDVDEQSDQSFPASDPPSFSRLSL